MSLFISPKYTSVRKFGFIRRLIQQNKHSPLLSLLYQISFPFNSRSYSKTLPPQTPILFRPPRGDPDLKKIQPINKSSQLAHTTVSERFNKIWSFPKHPIFVRSSPNRKWTENHSMSSYPHN